MSFNFYAFLNKLIQFFFCMKSKIIKITSISCILCLTKLSKTLSSISEIHSYRINILTKEIYIEYKRNLSKILLILKEKGFKFDKDNIIKKNFIIIVLIIFKKIIKQNIFINICFMLYIQISYYLHNKINYYMILSYLNIILYIINTKQDYLNNAFDILLFVSFNELLNKLILKLSKLNTFFVFENFKFRKIHGNLNKIYNFNSKKLKLIKMFKFNKHDKNKEDIFYRYENTLLKGDLIYLKQNEKVNFNGKLISKECFVDESFLTGEENIKKKFKNEIIKDGTIIKMGKALIEVTNITNFSDFSKPEKKSKFKIFIAIMNLLGLMIYFFKSSNLPDIINNIILLNMRICPCVFLISDILLKFKIKHEIRYNDIIVSNYDVIKRIKTIFIDKTGTLTDSIKITKFFLESKIKKIVIFLELKYQNIYSKGILEVLKASKHYNLIVEQDEYISTCGIRCKYKNNEIRIGKYSFCNYKNITHNYNINNNCIYVSVESKIAGFFHITSYVKKDAKNFINILKSKYKVILLSGDSKKNVVKVCHYLNITDYYYNITSEDKANVINNTQEMNCMIGDGFNDIPAFQRSNLSISMNNNLKADFCVNNDLKNILCILDIIRITNFKKNLNYLVSMIYNLIILFINPKFFKNGFLMYVPNIIIILNSIYFK